MTRLHDGAVIVGPDGKPSARSRVYLWRPDGRDRVDGRDVHRKPDPDFKTPKGRGDVAALMASNRGAAS